MQNLPPKDAEHYVVFCATSDLNIALDASSLISSLSLLLKRDVVTFEALTDLHFPQGFALLARENQHLHELCPFIAGQNTLPWRCEIPLSFTMAFSPLSRAWQSLRLEQYLVT